MGLQEFKKFRCFIVNDTGQPETICQFFANDEEARFFARGNRSIQLIKTMGEDGSEYVVYEKGYYEYSQSQSSTLITRIRKNFHLF